MWKPIENEEELEALKEVIEDAVVEVLEKLVKEHRIMIMIDKSKKGGNA